MARAEENTVGTCWDNRRHPAEDHQRRLHSLRLCDVAPHRHGQGHRPENQGRAQGHHASHQVVRHALLEQRLARDDVDHVGQAHDPDDDQGTLERPDDPEGGQPEPQEHIAEDRQPDARQAHRHGAEQDPADQAPRAEHGLEQAVGDRSVDPRVGRQLGGQQRGHDDGDASGELADDSLAGVDEQDDVAAEKAGSLRARLALLRRLDLRAELGAAHAHALEVRAGLEIGAGAVHALVTHAVFAEDAETCLSAAGILSLHSSDSIAHPRNAVALAGLWRRHAKNSLRTSGFSENGSRLKPLLHSKTL